METSATNNKEKKRTSKKRKFLIWLGVIVGVLILAIVGFAAKLYMDTKNTVDVIYEDIEQSELREEVVSIEEKEPISILMLGVDEREGDVGRSDTMIVLTINPETNDTKMLSIPRDTRTEIIGHDTTDKINHAYAFGGIEMSRQTVENLLEIPIDYVVQVNMESFKDIVDIVGGITIQNDLEFTAGNADFPMGTITLNGEEALGYVRMRYDDPEGDFGRQNRQKKVIQAISQSALSVDTALNYKSIFATLEDNVRLSASFDELLTIQKGYQDSFKSIEQLYMNNGQGTKIDGIYYYLPDEAEMETIKSTLKTHLGVKEID
ncbi:LCP family protein [Ureibacillus aquaedulcis]|uniref:LCP family protein n=1 Tax=Ureibacillus aquaedulcis TaxID=3058421 RepID=A0ABT8GUL9_9BACL|nr:LCP family protein [Ureibacillus sp. BA0131]MDN4495117.1 LCP family protein [Ureibacillus sp. BA0131]